MLPVPKVRFFFKSVGTRKGQGIIRVDVAVDVAVYPMTVDYDYEITAVS